VFATVGARGVEDTLAAYVDERVLFASTIVALVGATAWLALHRGVIGGLVATIQQSSSSAVSTFSSARRSPSLES
jgi:hypothetical protein